MQSIDPPLILKQDSLADLKRRDQRTIPSAASNIHSQNHLNAQKNIQTSVAPVPMALKKGPLDAQKASQALPQVVQKQQPVGEHKPAVTYAQLHRGKRSASQGVQKHGQVGASKYGGLAQPLIPQKPAAVQQPASKNGGLKKKQSVKHLQQQQEYEAHADPDREDKIVVNTSKGFDGLLFDLPKKKEAEPEPADTFDYDTYKQQVQQKPFTKPTINKLRQ